MASILPIPAPPRTPTPPLDDVEALPAGLGLDGMADMLSPTRGAFDHTALSPMSENFAASRYNGSPLLSLNQPLSPTDSLYSPMSTGPNGSQTGTSLQDGKGPFNFQPMSLAKSPITKSVSVAIGPVFKC